MHPRASLSAVSTFSWSLDQDLAFYAEAGVTNVGVSVAKLERAGWDIGTRRVVDAGVRVTNLLGLGPFRLDASEQWGAQRDRVHRAIEAGQALGAECVVFTTGPAGSLTWDQAADALEKALTPCLDHARASDLPFALEHTHALRVDVGFVHTLRDALHLAGRLGTGVCMEVNACWAERDLRESIASRAESLSLVQVSDFAIGTHSTPDRLVPGDGDIPLYRILGWLLESGYTGCFDLELVGPRIDAEGYASAARRGIEWLTGALDSLGATIST